MLACLSFLGGSALLLSLADLLAGAWLSAAGSVIFFALTLLNAVLLLRAAQPKCFYFVLFESSIFVYALFLLLTGGYGGTGPLWLLSLPVFCLIPLGLKRGSVLCTAILFSAVFLLYSPFFDGASAEYSPAFQARFPLLYLVFFLVGILMERMQTYSSRRHAQQQKDLEQISRTDTLTGICNRWWYNEQLKHRSGQPEYRRRYVLLLIDIDHFKTINDTYGHLCGDQVLIHTARIIEEAFRKDGIVCRWGGDEFLCQVRAPSPEQALSMAEFVRESIASMPFHAPDGTPLRITVSIGAVFVPNPQDIYSAKLFSIADQALYEAKNSGRNRVGFRVTAADETT